MLTLFLGRKREKKRERKSKILALARRGIAIPLVVVAFFVFMVFAGSFLFTSKGEYRLLMKTIERERARYIAEAGLARATALIYQNSFEDRWYRTNRSPYGFADMVSEDFGGGSYEVVAEDVINNLKSSMLTDKEERVTQLKYHRIDVFSRGTFGGSSIVLYQSIVLHPEEPVYTYTKTETGNLTSYSNIKIR